jgi:hypothetical protein
VAAVREVHSRDCEKPGRSTVNCKKGSFVV